MLGLILIVERSFSKYCRDFLKFWSPGGVEAENALKTLKKSIFNRLVHQNRKKWRRHDVARKRPSIMQEKLGRYSNRIER